MTIYYVDNSSSTASNNNAGTSADAPLETLAGVENLNLKPGDTVDFKAGTTYSQSAADQGALEITASGTAAAPITFGSYGTGAKPIINNTASGQQSDGIEVQGASYVVINGLAFGEAGNAGVSIDAQSSHVTVENTEASNVGFGVYAYGDNNSIEGNYYHDLHMVNNTPTSVNNNDDYGAVGIVINGNNDDVGFNKVVNAKAASYDYGHDGGGVETWGNVDGLTVHDNWVQDSEGFYEGGGGNVSNATFTNNVSLDNGGFMVLHNAGGDFGGTYTNVVASNNTIVEDKAVSDQNETLSLDGPATASQFDFRNNIVAVANGANVFNNDSNDHSGNLIELASGSQLSDDGDAKLGTGDAYGNPQFANAAADDFTPTASGIGAVGASLSSASTGSLSNASGTTSGTTSPTDPSSTTGTPSTGTPSTGGASGGSTASSGSSTTPPATGATTDPTTPTSTGSTHHHHHHNTESVSADATSDTDLIAGSSPTTAAEASPSVSTASLTVASTTPALTSALASDTSTATDTTALLNGTGLYATGKQGWDGLHDGSAHYAMDRTWTLAASANTGAGMAMQASG